MASFKHILRKASFMTFQDSTSKWLLGTYVQGSYCYLDSILEMSMVILLVLG